METSIVTPENRKILTVKLRRKTSRVSYSTDNRKKLKLWMEYCFRFHLGT